MPLVSYSACALGQNDTVHCSDSQRPVQPALLCFAAGGSHYVQRGGGSGHTGTRHGILSHVSCAQGCGKTLLLVQSGNFSG